jgi:hypothetical protein
VEIGLGIYVTKCESVILVILMEEAFGLYLEMSSWVMIYITNLMRNGAGVQALLRLSLKNLKGCNVGITDEGIREFRR